MGNNKKKVSKIASVALIYIAIFSLIVYIKTEYFAAEKSIFKKAYVESEGNHRFDYLPIIAKSVYVYDTNSKKVIYSKNAYTPLPIASISKVMTALVALETLGGDTIVTITDADIGQGSRNLKAGEKWKVSDLAAFMLTESSNAAAVALGRTLGGSPNMASLMNEKSESLGLFDTKFSNETGLDIGTSPGAYASAKDVAKMFEIALNRHKSVFGKTSEKSYNIESESGIMHNASNTASAIGSIPFIVASKTGLTDLAGGNLVFAINAGLNHQIIIVILGSTEEGRFSDAMTLSDAITKFFSDNINLI